MWGDGLTAEDCAAISQFRRSGRGLMITRDHMDLGSSVCTLGGVGDAHHFHSRNPDPDPDRRERDDPYTSTISWPNFHSGANGDYQTLEMVDAIHPVLAQPDSPTGGIRFLPSHPHEGGRRCAGGRGCPCHRRGPQQGDGPAFQHRRGIRTRRIRRARPGTEYISSLHGLQLGPARGGPEFCQRTPGAMPSSASRGALADTQRYMRNLALWLAGRPV